MPAVWADADLLRVIFVNLVGNATKFSRQAKAPRIEVEAQVEDRDVTICVRDNGIGFDPAVAGRLFDPFFRGHGAGFEGHGLGLSIVRRAVEAMGGRVVARRAATGGAEISFTLPGALVEQESLAAV
jgi:signal transduction histidine kinase